MAEPDQTGALSERENLHEQFGQCREVSAGKLAHGAEARPVQCCHCLEVKALLAGTTEAARWLCLNIGAEEPDDAAQPPNSSSLLSA